MLDMLGDLNNVLENSPPVLVDTESAEVVPESTEVVPESDEEISDPVEVYAYPIDGVYPSNIPSAAMSYFEGVLANNPGVKYVAYRADQYRSYLYYGDNLTFDGSHFGGNASYIMYNSYSDTTPITRGQGDIMIGSQGYIYSNLDTSFAVYPAAKGVDHFAILSFTLCVCVGLWIVQRIFFRR